MTLEGLGLSELAKLFAIFGGAMVLLYILRLRRRRVQVPFSPLWSRVVVDKQASSLFKALRRVGSLLVQLAVVALIIFALGDPKVASFGGCVHEDEKPPPPRHALLIIDASASMATVEGGRSRLALARTKAHEIIDELAVHPTQRVMVVQLDATTRPLSLWSSDPTTLHAAVDAVAAAPAKESFYATASTPIAMDTPTAIDEAVKLALDALRGRQGGETLLVSDLAFPPIDKAQREAIGLKVFPIGKVADNIGIEGFNVRPYLDDSVTYVAWYALRNESGKAVRANLFVYANPTGRAQADFEDQARLVHTEPLTLPANEVLRGHIQELKFPGSRIFARLVVDSSDPMRDSFDRDDMAFAVVPERRTIRVQLVTEGNLFINAALFLRENVVLTTRTPAEYKGPEGFDVSVIDVVAVDVSKPGNYLMIAPPASADFELKGVLEKPEIAKIDKKHMLARHVGFTDVNAQEANVYAAQKKDEVVVSAQGGVPLVFTRVIPSEAGLAGRRFVVLAFDLRNSLMPMSYGFPIFVVNALSSFWQDTEGLLQPNRAGVPLSVALLKGTNEVASMGPKGSAGPTDVKAANGPGEAYVTVLGPGAHDLEASARRVGDRAHFTAPRLGIWELHGVSEKTTTAVAVNLLSPEESRIEPQPDDYATWVAPVFEAPKENLWLRDFWRVLLLVALGVVMVEWVTWHRRVTL